MSIIQPQPQSACDSCCPDLTYKQRLIGFAVCSALGYVISTVGTLTLFGGFTNENIQTFAVLYVIGNIISIISSGFVSGPAAQCKSMWDESHRWVSGFYFSMIIVVFVVALTKQNIWLLIFCFVVEVLAATWYSISFIPFGRQIVCKFFRTLPCCAPCFAVSDSCSEGGGLSGSNSA